MQRGRSDSLSSEGPGACTDLCALSALHGGVRVQCAGYGGRGIWEWVRSVGLQSQVQVQDECLEGSKGRVGSARTRTASYRQHVEDEGNVLVWLNHGYTLR